MNQIEGKKKEENNSVAHARDKTAMLGDMLGAFCDLSSFLDPRFRFLALSHRARLRKCQTHTSQLLKLL